ncbi:hypothetical protein PTKIN_Ptkin14bG0061900 [Pterospermum kingtungense]
MAELLVKRCLHYLFCFNKIVEELRDQENKLTSAQSRVKEYVEEAKGDIETQVIEESVLNWLKDAETFFNDVQSLRRRIEENKRCFCWCPNWIRRYQLSKKIEEKTLAIQQLVTSSTFHIMQLSSKFHIMQFVESKSSNQAFNEIMEALNDDGVSMIGVWGMAGVGKTTLVTAVVNKVKKFQLCRKVITVVVSHDPDTGKIQDQIADSLDLKFTKRTQEGKAEELWVRLENEEKVLIILEDLWNELHLKKIGIPFDKNRKGCKIILTTRHRSVCESMGSQVMVLLGVLDEEEAWTLLKITASIEDATEGAAEVIKDFIKVFDGLPLAIVHIARAFRIRINSANDIEDTVLLYKNVYPSLEKSYNHLRSETTKRCLLLCALYARDDPIDVEDLVRYAWGLGLYQDSGSIEEVRSKVCKAINELKDSCLLLEGDQKRFIKMNGMVRVVVKWIASKEGSSLVINLEDESKNESSKQKLEILLLHRYFEVSQFENFGQMPKLKVLSLKGTGSYDQGLLFSLNALKSLKNLRTLQLDGFRQLEDMSALVVLTKLEVLSLHNSEFQEPIDILGELKNLRVLDIRQCKFLLRFPPNVIRRLVKVEELYLCYSTVEGFGVTMEEASAVTAILEELKFLPNLASLLLAVPSQQFSADFVFPKVGRYRIAINKCFETDPMTISPRFLTISKRIPLNMISELFQNVEFLEVSKIWDLQVIFESKKEENQAPLLSNLEYLCLRLLPSLEYIWKMPIQHMSLGHLKAIKIVECDKLKYLFSFSVGRSLECLEELEIKSCHGLEQIVEESEEISPNMNSDNPSLCLPKLRSVDIRYCPWLIYIFPKFMAPQGLLQLQKLVLWHLPDLKQICAPAKEREENGILLPQPQLLFQSLSKLEVIECSKLANAKIHSGPLGATLKDIWLYGVRNELCGEIIQLQGGYFLSSLEKLILEDLYEFIWKDPSQIVTLQHLSYLKMANCCELRNIFSTVVARNLPQLRYLQVVGCHQLEHVIVEDRTPSPSMAGQKPHVYFPNLEELHVDLCYKLKSLFPVTASCLPKLKKLVVQDASDLREIFGHDNEATIMTYDEKLNQKLLPKLEELILEDLPKFIRFSTASYNFELPALISLTVVKCPSIRMRFSTVHDDSGGSYVRADMEKSLLPKDGKEVGSITIDTIEPNESDKSTVWKKPAKKHQFEQEGNDWRDPPATLGATELEPLNSSLPTPSSEKVKTLKKSLQELVKTEPNTVDTLIKYSDHSLSTGQTINVFEDGSFPYPTSGAYVGHEHISQIAFFKEIEATCILTYMSFLYKRLEEQGLACTYGFIDPSRISRNIGNVDSAKLVALALEGAVCDQLFFAPYNSGGHWLLIVIDPYDDVVYFLDSMRGDPDAEIKETMENGLGLFNEQNKRNGRKSTTWKKIKGPLQSGVHECGYYVMRYMKEIIENRILPISYKFLEKKEYTKDELDEVRREWCTYVSSILAGGDEV